MIDLPLRRCLAVVWTGAALLAGCANGPPAASSMTSATAEPALAPAVWREATPGAPVTPTPARWWRTLDDATLDTLIARALAAAPDLQTAQARLREARAARQAAQALRGPSVTAGPTVTRSRSSGETAAGVTRTLYDVGLDASWEIDLFGRVQAGVDAAGATEAAAQASLDDVRRTLQAEVAADYLDWRGARARQAIARDALARLEETLQITRWRTQAGLTSSLDVESARASVEQTRASLAAYTGSVTQARLALELLLGLPAGALADELAAVPQADRLPAWPWPQGLALPADVLRQRPDVRAAAAQWQAQLATAEQARAALRPSLTLSGSLGLQALSPSRLAQGGYASVVGALVAPIFDGGRLRAQLDAQTAAADRLAIAYRVTMQTALTEVEQVLASAAQQRDQARALVQAAEAARNAALMARQRYDSGLVDFRTVLDAERSALTLDDSVAALQIDALKAVVRLYKALGGADDMKAGGATAGQG